MELVDSFLDIKNLYFSYSSKKEPVLKDFNLKVQAGSIHALVGASGTGKSTLLSLIAGFEKQLSGSIDLGTQCISSNKVCLPTEKRQIGFLFQDNTIFPHLNIEENLSLALSGFDRSIRAKKVDRILELVHLEHTKKMYPDELSGGQVQRVCLAMALIREPKLLLLDEPFSNLDQSLKYQLIPEIRSLLKDLGMTTLIVTHDLREAFDISDLTSVIHGGKVLQTAPSDELYFNPCHELVWQLLEPCNCQNSHLIDGRIQTPFGILEFDLEEKDKKLPLCVVFRPEQLELNREKKGIPVQVIHHSFRGLHWVICVRLSDGTQLSVASSQRFTGEDAYLQLKDSELPMIFRRCGERVKSQKPERILRLA